MQVIKDNKSLAAAIAQMENIQKSEGHLLKEHFKFTIDSLNPMNIIKEKFNETISAPGLKSELIQGALGLATGFLTNRFLLGPSAGIVKNIAGTLVQKGLSKINVNPKNIKESGISFLKNVLKKMKIQD